MGPRQQNTNDPTVVGRSTSIALLQERFKQLERVKVMREERELQLLLMRGCFVPAVVLQQEEEEEEEEEEETTDSSGDHQHQQQPNWPFSHARLLRTSRPLSAAVTSAPSSSRLDTFSRRDRPDLQALDLEASLYSTGLFGHEITSRPASMDSWNATVGEAADIDTSLHL